MLERQERFELQRRIEKAYGDFQEARVHFLTVSASVEDRRLEVRKENSEGLREESNERKYKASLERLYSEDRELKNLLRMIQRAEHDLERKKADVEAVRLTVRLWGAPVPEAIETGD